MKNVLFNPVGYGRSAEVLKKIDRWNNNIPIRAKKNKYLKMAYSPFVFFRGTSHLFWSDFYNDWRLNKFGGDDTKTWVQGDSHVENFGAFHNTKHEIVYGLNDFDEAVVADYQYDVWRMAVSLVLVLQQKKRLSYKEQKNVLNAFSSTYLEILCSYHEVKNKEIKKIYFTANNTSGLLKRFLKKTKKSNSYHKMLEKWLCQIKNHHHFNLDLTKLDEISHYEREDIKSSMVYYGRTLSGNIKYRDKSFYLEDIARRLEAGTGSLGTSRYYALIENQTNTSIKGIDDHILDIKYQGKPTPYYFFSTAEKNDYDLNVENDAQRHAEAYKALTYDPDDFLGWMKLADGYYSVRERSPFKKTFPSENLVNEKDFIEMSKQWAIILATGHERASRYLDHSLAKKMGAISKNRRKAFQATVQEVAFSYAEQVARDWHYFVKSLRLTTSDLKKQHALI